MGALNETSANPKYSLCGQGGEDDPHAADWLTGTWLEEQLNGQRHLAGLINTLEAFRLIKKFIEVTLSLRLSVGWSGSLSPVCHNFKFHISCSSRSTCL